MPSGLDEAEEAMLRKIASPLPPRKARLLPWGLAAIALLAVVAQTWRLQSRERDYRRQQAANRSLAGTLKEQTAIAQRQLRLAQEMAVDYLSVSRQLKEGEQLSSPSQSDPRSGRQEASGKGEDPSRLSRTRSDAYQPLAKSTDARILTVSVPLPAGEALRPTSEFATAKPSTKRDPDVGQTWAMPLEPVDTRLVSDRPIFHWTPVSGIRVYTVTVRDEKGNDVLGPARAEWDGKSPEVVWIAPALVPRRAKLMWGVRAGRPDDLEAPSLPNDSRKIGRFLVVARPDLIRYARAHLALGLLYLHDRLLIDSRRELLAAKEAAESTYEGKLARSLLAAVQAAMATSHK